MTEHRSATVLDQPGFAERFFFPNPEWLPRNLAEARKPAEERALALARLPDPTGIPLSLPDDFDDLLASAAALLQAEAARAGRADAPQGATARPSRGGRGAARLRRLWRGRGAPAPWTIRIEGLVSDATATMAGGFPAMGAELSFSVVAGLGQSHDARPGDLPLAHLASQESWVLGDDAETAATPAHPHDAVVIASYVPAMAWAGEAAMLAGHTTAGASPPVAVHAAAIPEGGPAHAPALAEATDAFPSFWHAGPDWAPWLGLDGAGLTTAGTVVPDAGRMAAAPPAPEAAPAEPAAAAAPAPRPAGATSGHAAVADTGSPPAARPAETTMTPPVMADHADKAGATGTSSETLPAATHHAWQFGLPVDPVAVTTTQPAGINQAALPAAIDKLIGIGSSRASSASDHRAGDGQPETAAAGKAAGSDHSGDATGLGKLVDLGTVLPAAVDHSGQGKAADSTPTDAPGLGKLVDATAALPAAVDHPGQGKATDSTPADAPGLGKLVDAAAALPAAVDHPGQGKAADSAPTDAPGLGKLVDLGTVLPAVIDHPGQGKAPDSHHSGDTVSPGTPVDLAAILPAVIDHPGQDAATAKPADTTAGLPADRPGEATGLGTLLDLGSTSPAVASHPRQDMAADKATDLTATSSSGADHPPVTATPHGTPPATPATADGMPPGAAPAAAGHPTQAVAGTATPQPPAATPEGNHLLAAPSALPTLHHPGQADHHGTPAADPGAPDQSLVSKALSAVAAGIATGPVPAHHDPAAEAHAAELLLPDALGTALDLTGPQDSQLLAAHPGELPLASSLDHGNSPLDHGSALPTAPADHPLL